LRFTTSGKETERVYSDNPGARTGRNLLQQVRLTSMLLQFHTASQVLISSTGLHPDCRRYHQHYM